MLTTTNRAFEPLNWGAIGCPEDTSPLGTLTTLAKIRILTFLDLPDLAHLSLASKHWNHYVTEDQVWRSIAGQIRCPINKNVPVFSQVVGYIDHIRTLTRCIAPPEDLIPMLKGTRIAQVNHFVLYILSSAELEKWKFRIDCLRGDFPGLNLDPGFGQCVTSQQVIDLAAKFSAWREQKKSLFEAKHILNMWKTLARRLNVEDPIFEQTEAIIIAKAAEYENWFVDHRERLSGILGNEMMTSLDSFLHKNSPLF